MPQPIPPAAPTSPPSLLRRLQRWLRAAEYTRMVAKLRAFIVIVAIISLVSTCITITTELESHRLDQEGVRVSGIVEDVKFIYVVRHSSCHVEIAVSFSPHGSSERVRVRADDAGGTRGYTNIGICGPTNQINKGDSVPVDYAASGARVNRIIWHDQDVALKTFFIPTVMFWCLLVVFLIWNHQISPTRTSHTPARRP